MAKDVKFNIKLTVDGKAQVVQAVTSTKELQAAVDGAKSSTANFASTLIKLNQTVEVFDNAADALSKLQGALKGLSEGAANAEIANTKLTTVMRQRMNASDEDVAAIKKVIAAQKELGVIGGTVQMAGAQQVATFLKQRSSLEVLIPAMNDLLAQQKGVNASQEDAVSVANLMGKVMTGQTSALKRVGITFDEAQENILKYGTESEKAATLAQVITDNVGEMNKELANTDAGKQKQLEMAFAGIKNKIGAIAQQALPYVSFAAQSAILLSSTLKLANGFKVVAAATGLTKIGVMALNTVTKAYRVSAVTMSAMLTVIKAKLTGVAVGATTAKVAMRGFIASTGIGLVIVAVTAALTALINKLDETKQKTQELTDCEESGREEAVRVQGELDAETLKLKGLMDAKKDTTAEVNHLNEAYGNIFGQHKTAAEWYDTLTKKSGIYVKQLAAEATMKAYAAKIADVQMKLDENYQKRADLWKSGNAVKTYKYKVRDYMNGGDSYDVVRTEDTSDYAALKSEGREYNAQLNALQAGLKKAVDNSVKWANALNAKDNSHSTATATPKATAHTTPKATPKAAPKAEKIPEGVGIAEFQQAIGEVHVKIVPDTDEALRQTRLLFEGLTIPVEEEPILRGSLADKRQSLSNAQSKASTIQSDYDLHLIDIDTAKAQLDELNKIIATFGEGIEPFKLEVDTKDFSDQIAALSGVSVTSFESVRDNLQQVSGLSDSTAKGFAIAGDSALMLGQALQQLGQDSAAGKVGMVLAAVGQLALSFAQAMVSASSNWITWLAFGITGTAQLISLVSTIQGFATGGIVPGGSKTGDKVVARVNSGEMILNTRQQANLFKMLNNGRVAAPETYQPKSFDVSFDAGRIGDSLYKPGGDFNFTISGRNLVGVLANETRSTSRKSNILI